MTSTKARLARLETRVRQRRRLPTVYATPTLPLLDWTANYLPTTQTCEPSFFHRWLCSTLDALKPAARLAVQAPRGSAKSSFASLAYPLREALEGREPFIVICSDTSSQAKDFLRQIRREIESNELLRDAYPGACRPGTLWRDDRISLGNGCEIAAMGTGGKIRGRKSAANRRPTLIIGDDLQNKDHIQSALRRRRSLEWLHKDVLNAGEPNTKYVVVGTALHREAIVCELERAAGWLTRKFQAVVNWPTRLDLWREFEARLFDYSRPDAEREALAVAFYHDNRSDMDRGAELLWPARQSLLSLMTKRASDGYAAFESECQNNPINPAECEWPPELFDHPNLFFDQWPSDLVVRTIALDPSKGKDSKQGDYSAIVRFGRDRNGLEYVEADQARRPIDVQCHDLARHCEEFRPHGVAVETQCFQELMVVPIQHAARAAGIEMPIYKCEQHVAKIVRIRQLTTPLSQRRVRFKTRSPGTQLLLQQLRDVPHGETDDGPDAMREARQLAIELTRNKAARPGRRHI